MIVLTLEAAQYTNRRLDFDTFFYSDRKRRKKPPPDLEMAKMLLQ